VQWSAGAVPDPPVDARRGDRRGKEQAMTDERYVVTATGGSRWTIRPRAAR
jgi:hypothetical protein